MSGSLDRYRTLETDDLVSAWRDLGGLVRAAEAQRLQMLAVLAEREAHRADGCLDAAQWVAANDMITAGDAKSAVATAARLEALPAITAVAEAGGLSMAQLVPLVQIADADNDEHWAKEGPACTPAALAQLARQRRLVSREQVERQQHRKQFRWWKDRHGLGTRFAGLLPDDMAAIVSGELDARAERMPKNGDGTWDPYVQRCADALAEVCSESAGEAGRPEVVVHVPVGVEKLSPTLADGTPMSVEVIRRLACDATVRLLVENPDGTVAGYGRRRRIVPDKMRARLLERDQGHCRWTGCTCARGLKAHHIAEWIADLGETEERNCLMLCPKHHSLVHEGGWAIVGDANGTLQFRRPWGTPLPTSPATAPPELRERFGFDAARPDAPAREARGW